MRRDAPRPHVDDLARDRSAAALQLARELQALGQIQCRRARLRFENGAGHVAAVGLPRRRRSSQRIRAHHKNAIGRGHCAQPAQGVRARQIHQRCIVAIGRLRQQCAHPCRSIEHEHVIAPRSLAAAELEFRDGEQQQSHPDQLQQQRKRLLDAVAARDRRGLARLNPESQRGNDQLPARAVEQIDSHRDGCDRAERREELNETEVEKFHHLLPMNRLTSRARLAKCFLPLLYSRGSARRM